MKTFAKNFTRTFIKAFSKHSILLSALCLSTILLAADVPAGEADQPLQDGQEIVSLDFDDGTTQGFAIYTNGGSCDISNSEGSLAVDIHKCGNLDYANQVYWDGFALSQDCVYTYSFDISCDIERKVDYRLQLNGGDYHAYYSGTVLAGEQPQTVTGDWTMAEESDPAPRIVFNMGKMDDMSDDPGEHRILIDNIRLIVKNASSAKQLEGLPDYPALTMNQLGFRPGDDKAFVFRDDSDTNDGKDNSGDDADSDNNGDDDSSDNNGDNSGSETGNASGRFYVINNSTGDTVLEGELSETVYNRSTQTRVKTADFSEVNVPGEYYIKLDLGNTQITGDTQISDDAQVSGDTQVSDDTQITSDVFEIGDTVYEDLFKGLVHMLYLQRCGAETDAQIAGSFAHGVCHSSDAIIYGTDKTKDVSGGWHDAGDYGRYVVSGVKAAADLLNAWEYGGIDADDLGIPESGNGIPDILDEVRYELEWLLKMQDDETGGVYHKVTGYAFPGEVMPEEETDQLVIAPISTAATGDFAAIMAKASVIWKDMDPEFSELMLAASLRAWDYIKDAQDSTGFVNPPEISTGEYPDRGTYDEIFWAAAELYLAGESSFSDELTSRYSSYLRPGLGWNRINSYAFYDLLEASPEGIDEVLESCRQQLIDEADEILENSRKDAYGISLGSEFPWGSNMTAANNGVALYMASRLTTKLSDDAETDDAKNTAAVNTDAENTEAENTDAENADTENVGSSEAGSDDSDEYLKAAKRHLDYLLGCNGLGYCFVTGFGSTSPDHPHHRPSQAAGETMPGMLVGGPDSNLEDPYAKGVLTGQAPAMCYVDNEQSYSTNEVCVYWNSPLIWLMAALS